MGFNLGCIFTCFHKFLALCISHMKVLEMQNWLDLLCCHAKFSGTQTQPPLGANNLKFFLVVYHVFE